MDQWENESDQGQQNYYQDHIEEYRFDVDERYAYQQVSDQGAEARATAGLILGIVSIVTSCCLGIGFIVGIVGLILSLSAQKNSQNGMAIAGIVLSIVGIVMGLGFFVVIAGAILLNW